MKKKNENSVGTGKSLKTKNFSLGFPPGTRAREQSVPLCSSLHQAQHNTISISNFNLILSRGGSDSQSLTNSGFVGFNDKLLR